VADHWLALPLLTLVCSALALAPLGQQVLNRGVVFIDLAVAQSAAASTLWLGVFHHTHDSLVLLPTSVAGALVCALAVSWISRARPAQREALIGLLYMTSAMLALLAAHHGPHGKEDLYQLLAADLLWSDAADAFIALACSLLVLTLRVVRPGFFRRDAVFYLSFGLVTSLLVQSIGVFLLFALLIGPAILLARFRTPMVVTTVAVSIGAGFWASWSFDLSSGACLTLAIALTSFLSLVPVSRRRLARTAPQ
jgi:zinc/manganese transport system permease protein